MSLTPGSRIGPYEIRSPLGEGAMGVVFRAHDTKLQRDVALKVLPDHFASDPERLARFQREAQLLASLNHPNIAHIYGLEQSGDSGCIIMELVEGETLAERISRGAIPFDETLEIAQQIADALEAAHERGIVHRDLKPANIKLTLDGKVKVLDFGLAKALAIEGMQVGTSNLPTTTGSMAGAIIGTPGYMAPEQARGRQTDKRADIWAFGCILFEMLTGTQAFAGEDAADALGAVIHKEPAWDRAPARALPLLRRCLEKDPKKRLRDIGDAMVLIEQAPAAPAAQPRTRRWFTWAAVAVSLLFATLLLLSSFDGGKPPAATVRFLLPPPDKTGFETYITVSPDGRRLAFTAVGADAIQRLYVRDLDKVDSRLLPGTELAGSPFWSHDSKLLAFSVGPELKKIDPAGGPVSSLAKGDTTFGLGAWGSDDVIVFGHRTLGPLFKVAAAGGVPTPVTALNRERADVAHSIPSFLPDGRNFVYFVITNKAETTGIYLGSLNNKPDGQPTTQLVATNIGGTFVASPDGSSGEILYLRNNNLMSQPFDIAALALRGEPTLVAERVESVASYGVFSASKNGVLAYRGSRPPLHVPAFLDHTGHEVGVAVKEPLEGATYPALSPDGKRLAIVISKQLWVYDIEGRPPIKLTSDGSPATPIWTRDGQRIIFEPNSPGWERGLASLPSDGSTTKLEPASPTEHVHPLAWTPDGKELIAARLGTQSADIVKFPTRADGKIETIVQAAPQEGILGASVSPDGRWLAYTAASTGNTEVWVRPYGRDGSPVRVSPSGGFDPLWSKDGRGLFYRSSNKVMTVAVEAGTSFNFKPATTLFEGTFIRAGQAPSWGIAPNGQFLLIRPVDTAPSPVTVILNWNSKEAR